MRKSRMLIKAYFIALIQIGKRLKLLNPKSILPSKAEQYVGIKYPLHRFRSPIKTYTTCSQATKYTDKVKDFTCILRDSTK